MNTKRIALVTGANRGLGREIARGLAGLGMHVIVASRNLAAGEQVAAELRADGLEAEAQPLEVSSAESVATLARRVAVMHGRLQVLVNSAGVLLDGYEDSVLELSVDTLRATLETNLFGALRVTQAFVPAMLEAGFGRVVMLSSGMGQLTDMQSGAAAYRISKTALNALTRTLAAECVGTKVKVNAMCPGWCRTDMGGPNATRSAAEGADTALWLATLPDDGPSGGFFRDREPIPW
jgi:NAD(P)-dependent dehydrogenase (short-subunit alcohol dehydrogenase family)